MSDKPSVGIMVQLRLFMLAHERWLAHTQKFDWCLDGMSAVETAVNESLFLLAMTEYAKLQKVVK